MCNQVYIIQKSKNVFYVTFIANLRVTQLAHQGAHVTTCRGPGPPRGPGPSNFWRVFRPVHGPAYAYHRVSIEGLCITRTGCSWTAVGRRDGSKLTEG